MTKHTPGPWTAGEIGTSESNEDWAYIRSEKITPVDVMQGKCDIAEFANYDDAVLAAAAPDLLAACELVVEWLGEPRLEESDNANVQFINALRACRAAIAKAEESQ